MISIIIPVIRPEKAQRCIDAIRANAGIPETDHYEILALPDTDGIGCPRMVKQLAALTINEMIMFLGDDTIPQPGFLKAALDAMNTLPDGWGLVALNDGIWNGKLATHWLASKKLFDYSDGEFFSTAYNHCFCDKELTDIAQDLGRYVYAEDAKIIHDHPHVTGEALDEGYAKVYQRETFMADRKTYHLRKIARKGFNLAIGLPLSGTFREDDFWLSFMCMDTPDYRLYVPDVPIGHFERDIAYIRNNLIQQALADGKSHLIMLDTDQIYPRDTITKLIAQARAGRKIVVAPVHRRYPPFETILMRGAPDQYTYVADEEKYSGNLIPIDASGTGCMMIDMTAVLDLDEPYFELGTTPKGRPMGEDIGFCARLRQNGVEIWADTSITIDHIARIKINREFYEVSKWLNGYTLRTQAISP